MTTPAQAPLVVLIHGAWAAGWVWDTIAPDLRDAGYAVAALDLPTAVEDANLDGYVAAVIEEMGERDHVVLVGHSGGGVVVSAVAELLPDRVSGIVYVTGILLPPNRTFPELCAEAASVIQLTDGVLPFLERPDEFTTVVPADAGVAVFFHDAPPAAAITAARRLTPQHHHGLVMTVTTTTARFGSIPRLYIEAANDRSIPLSLQRFMQQLTPGGSVVTLPADHAPQLSAPAALVSELLTFLRIVDAPSSTAPSPSPSTPIAQEIQ
ncbi:alpha/beta fold hydrolase [Microbacterium aurantiacum]|uniref:alpha/beta fold hydrolase n=1 Tax=Microbacterium aurantiacum TaxID=162393 RepID=UPI001F1CFDF8|nr:alpha/beta hydrolase [Microbacterium aurantiacum]